MLFFFDFDNYFKMVRLAWNEKSPRARLYYLAVLCLGVPVTAIFHAFCFALDRLFFPGLAKVDVKEPVFIIGHGRSGTTLTFRLMSQDEGRFSSFLLWECYFPSVLQKKAIRTVAQIDARLLGGVLGKLAGGFEDWRYGPSRHIHTMGLTLPEEDDISLFYSMAAGFWITKMPWMGELDFYYVDEWPEWKRRRLNEFYRELVRRQLYLNGSEKIHLAKNPFWAGRVGSLIETFPDAKFVVNVRDPRATIPSLLKLMRGTWKNLGWDDARQKRCLEVLAGQSWHNYRHPLEVLEASAATRSAVLEYDHLTADPAAAIAAVYEKLELPMSDDFREALSHESKREKKHRTGYTYSLEEFGLDADAIKEKLGDLFERFGWDENDDSAESARAQGEA